MPITEKKAIFPFPHGNGQRERSVSYIDEKDHSHTLAKNPNTSAPNRDSPDNCNKIPVPTSLTRVPHHSFDVMPQRGRENKSEFQKGCSLTYMKMMNFWKYLKEKAAPAHKESGIRVINIADPSSHSPPYISNVVRSTKYTLNPISCDFIIWKNLYEQLHRKANLYFLVIGCLQTVPGISPTGRWTTLTTLLAVMIFSMLQAAYEDYQRYKEDKKINDCAAFVLRHEGDTAQFVQVQHKDIRVGDMVCVYNKDSVANEDGSRNNVVPCDIVMFMSGGGQESDGVAFVETSNLDGETNLKSRQCIDLSTITAITITDLGGKSEEMMVIRTPHVYSPFVPRMFPNDDLHCRQFAGSAALTSGEELTCATSSIIISESMASLFYTKLYGMRIECETPNDNLYTFTGNVIDRSRENKVSITPNNVMYRGSSLRKVPWSIGVCIFTGNETKIMMNAHKATHKASRVERLVNWLLICVLVLLVVMVLTSAVAIVLVPQNQWYLKNPLNTNSKLKQFVSALGTFLILFNNLIPISLYVTIEIIKLLQGRFIEWDLCMYYKEKDMRSLVKATNLNEELGQVNYIFSDKTGTLTCNVMTFMKFIVGGKVYGTGYTEIGKAVAKQKGIVLVDNRPEDIRMSEFPFYDERLRDGKWWTRDDSNEMKSLFTLMAVCHTVVMDEDMHYAAECPDEEALVKGAAGLGVRFVSRKSQTVTIEMGSARVPETYKILDVIPFDSDRRRMSVLVEVPNDGGYKLLSKGADCVMFARLHDSNPSSVRDDTMAALVQFAEEGLRVLVACDKIISKPDALDWSARYRVAKETVGDDKGRKEMLSQLEEEIEKDLMLIGVTGIEDKLQVGVPETIEAFRSGGIKVWMLTGDKIETAINIGYACSLLYAESCIHAFTGSAINEGILSVLNKENWDSQQHHSVVIDGDSLSIVLNEPYLLDCFYAIISKCNSVICCRVSPKQKAMIVNLVRAKAGVNTVTLAVGDGANDVPMIQAAHVGIGISGMEGQQASNSADYAIGQFRFLRRLVMVHGRANYYRLAGAIRYFFYKNVLLVMTQFWFCFFNLFTGESLYEKWSLVVYNVIFTAIPVIVYGVLDREILNTDNVLAYPQLYMPGIKSTHLSFKVFLLSLGNAIMHSLIIFFGVITVCNTGYGVNEYGQGSGLDGDGAVMMGVIVIVVNGRLALYYNSVTYLDCWITIGSVVMYFVFHVGYGLAIRNFNMSGDKHVEGTFSVPLYWLSTIFTVTVCLFIDFNVIYATYNFLTLTLSRMVQLKDSMDPKASVKPPSELNVKKKSDECEHKGNLPHITSTIEDKISYTQDTFMQFEDLDLEEEFVYPYVGTGLTRYKIALGLSSFFSIFICISNIVYYYATNNISPMEIAMWGLYTFSSIGGLLILMFTSIHLKSGLHKMLLIIMTINFSSISIANLIESNRRKDTHPVALGVIILGLLTLMRPPLVHGIQYASIAVVSFPLWELLISVEGWKTSDYAIRILEVLIVAITSITALAISESFSRRMFISQHCAQIANKVCIHEENRSVLLLHNVFPSAIVNDIRVNKRALSQFSVRYEIVSVLHCSVHNFATFCSSHEPTVVVEIFNKLFTLFDAEAKALKLEKIKTIGDKYICAAGIPIPDHRHQEKIIMMGLRMIEAVNSINCEGRLSSEKGQNIEIRIGVASGKAYGGVVGLERVKYEVFGEAAELSELNERQGLPSRVHIDPRMKNNTTQQFFTFKEDKGKYFVDEIIDHSGTEMLFDVESEDHDISWGDIPPPLQTSELTGDNIYTFLEEADIFRRKAIDVCTCFEGEMKMLSLQFENDVAEEEFHHYKQLLAQSRIFHESIQGVYFFFAATSLLYLFTTNHPLMIFTFLIAIAHLVIVIYYIYYKLSSRRDKNKRRMKMRSETIICSVLNKNSDDNDNSSENEDEFASKNLLCGNMIINSNGVKNNNSVPSFNVCPSGSSTPQTKDITNRIPNFKLRKTVRTLIRIYALVSGLLALMISCIAFFTIDKFVFVNVFIILAGQCFAFSFLHMGIIVKLAVSIVHFTIVLVGLWYDVIYTSNEEPDYIVYAVYLFAIVLCFILVLTSSYIIEKNIRLSFAARKRVLYQNAEASYAKVRSDKLLNNALPNHVVKRLKGSPDGQIVDDATDASVLYIYTDNVTTQPTHNSNQRDVDNYDASVIMNDINSLIWTLDAITVKYNVDKISSYPYCVISGCPEKSTDHALRLAMCAIDMISAVKRMNTETHRSIMIRAGIHTGHVTAGLLGSSKFLYDVFGDTVNMASIVAANAPWGDIHVSKQTAMRLSNKYDVSIIGDRGGVCVPGGRREEVYVLNQEGREP